MEAEQAATRLLLDSSVQIDRIKAGERKRYLDDVLSKFDFRIATSISLLEFKAVVIQECITIHNALRRTNARFTAVRDQLVESNHRQHRLRAHIFNNHINVLASSFEIDEAADVKLAEKARLLLEMHIPRFYRWFRDSVDAVLEDEIKCDRAKEPPIRKNAVFSTNLPTCKRGINKTCRVEDFVRLRLPQTFSSICEVADSSEQLVRSKELFAELANNPTREWTHSDCRNAGDCLIAFEGTNHATHAASTNRSEWEPLSRILGFELIPLEYPKRG